RASGTAAHFLSYDYDSRRLLPSFPSRRSSDLGSPHPRIPLPASLYPGRANSRGVDLDDERGIAAVRRALAHAGPSWSAAPIIGGIAVDPPPVVPACEAAAAPGWRTVRNPACRAQVVGLVRETRREEIERA